MWQNRHLDLVPSSWPLTCMSPHWGSSSTLKHKQGCKNSSRCCEGRALLGMKHSNLLPGNPPLVSRIRVMEGRGSASFLFYTWYPGDQCDPAVRSITKVLATCSAYFLTKLSQVRLPVVQSKITVQAVQAVQSNKPHCEVFLSSSSLGFLVGLHIAGVPSHLVGSGEVIF